MGINVQPFLQWLKAEIKWLKDVIKWYYHKVLHYWREFDVIVLLALGAITIIFGVKGYSEYFSQYSVANNLSPPYSYIESIYRSALLFKATININGHLNIWLEVARWSGLLILFYAVIKGGMELFYKQINMLLLKWVIKGHVVITGFSDEGILLAKNFIKNDSKVVIIDNNAAKTDHQKCRELGIILIDKDPVDEDALQKAQVQKAKYVINLMKNDGRNVESAINSYQLKSQSKNVSPLSCYVHISDRQLHNQLEMKQSDYNTPRFAFEYFNMYDNAARALLNKYPIFIDKFTGSNSSPQVLIVGSEKLSESLIIYSARTWLPHYLKRKKKIEITLVSRQANLTINSITVRYPEIVNICDFHTVNRDFDRSELQSLYISQIKKMEKIRLDNVTSVYVCLNDDAANLSAALTLYETLVSPDISIVACMHRDGGLASLIEWNRTKDSRMKNLQAFGLIDNACRQDIVVGGVKKKLDTSVIPQAMYEYYVNNQATGASPAAESVVSWDKLTEDEKESNRRPANALAERLAYAGYLIVPASSQHYQFIKIPDQDIDKLAEWEHKRWYDEKISAGWQYGPVRYNDKKINDNLLPWDQLSPAMKEYNLKAAAEIPMFLFEIGFQIKKMVKDNAVSSKQSPLITVKT